MTNFDEVSYDLSTEVNTNFSTYLKMMNLNNDRNILILSPVNHYYYNFDEIRSVRTLVHTKELNKVRDVHKFLSDVSRILSMRSTFVGCFEDNMIRKTTTQIDKILFWFSHFTETNGRTYLSRKIMLKMFLKYGFTIIDLTEMGGLTYFCIKRH